MAVSPAAAAAVDPAWDALAAPLVDRIAQLLQDSAIVVGDQATWLTPRLATTDPGTDRLEDAEPTIARTGVACLYDGSAGIGWALATVATRRGRTDLEALAKAALRHALARAEDNDRPGLYDGVAGIGLAAVAGGRLLGAADLTAAGAGLLHTAGAATPASDDLIDGTAGIALACRRGSQLTGDEGLLAAAQRHAMTLLAHADRRPWGWCWPSADGPGLCGLAHGAAGAAWALGEVAAADIDPAADDGADPTRPAGAGPDAAAARDGLTAARDAARRYERSWFDPRSSTWPDLREDVADPDEPPPRPNLWCHGGVGIGLSRLALHALDPHPALLGEAIAARAAASREAAQQVRSGQLTSGLTVCHGLGGTLALLLTVADHLDAPEHRQTAGQLLAGAVDHLGDDPAAWPGGLLNQPGPGLMTGLAGTMLVLAGMDDPAALDPITRLDARTT